MKKILIILFLSTFNYTAKANDISSCLIIENNEKRLSCYDSLAKKSKEIKPTISNKKKLEDSFGKIKKEKKKIDKIESRMIGNFKEWKEGMIIELENGQKWKVANSPRGYKKMMNPKVIITRGIFSTYNMKIEGLNSTAKVKRVK